VRVYANHRFRWPRTTLQDKCEFWPPAHTPVSWPTCYRPPSWRAAAAYLYALRLGREALAWEYLRRNEAYQSAWLRSHSGERADAAAWGLLAFEDPSLNGLEAVPPWSPVPDAAVCIGTPDIPHLRSTTSFSLWALPGRKCLTYVASCFELTHSSTNNDVHVVLGSRWTDGDQAVYLLPLDSAPQAQSHSHRYAAFHPAAGRRGATTTAGGRLERMHMRMLQALDGAIAGASQREIATVVFGTQRAAADWSSDSALRAQTRHAIRRARALMNGGYRQLLLTGRRTQ
jgi:hypothetical protein